MNSHLTPTSPTDDDFEVLLRSRLHSLAAHAPATVRLPDEVTVHATPPRSRRRAGAITATFAAVVGGIGITTVALNGADEGGASSPEAAVVKMIDAFNDQDVVGMVDIIDPTEVAAVRSTLDEATTEAKRLELLSDGFSLQSIEGLEFEVSDLTLSTVDVADDLAVVEATGGNLAAGFDPEAFPMGSRIREVAKDMDRVEGTVELADVSPLVMAATVQRDGRWYVSLAYTVAEYARQAAGVDFPTTPGVTPEGFDSPEAATTALYQRLLALDLPGAVATAAPGEGDALARYAPLWLPNVAGSTANLTAEGWSLTLESMTFTTRGDGPRKTVSPTAFAIAGTVPASFANDDNGMPPLDPTLPTQIYVPKPTGESVYVIVPAGEPVPESVTGLPTMTYEEVFVQYGDAPFNYTSSFDTGSVMPFADPADDTAPVEPLPFRVEGGSDCTTISGAGATGWFSPAYSDVWTQVGDEQWQTCGGSTLGALSVLALGVGVDLAPPSIATVEVDGRWYISPIATLTASAVEALRSIDSPDDLFDSAVGWYLYGIDRNSLDRALTGTSADSLSQACAAIVSVREGVVTGLIDVVTGAQAHACYDNGGLYSDIDNGPEPAGEDVTVETTPGPTDATEPSASSPAATDAPAITEPSPVPDTVPATTGG